MSEQQTGQPWWTGLPDDVEPASDTQLANVVRNGLRPGRGSKVLLPWPLMLRVLRRVAEKDAEIAKWRRMAFGCESAFTAAEAEVERLREALAKVEALFAGGPDTACRTTWHDGPFDTRIECVEVPLDDLRAALASVPAVDAGDREPASEVQP